MVPYIKIRKANFDDFAKLPDVEKKAAQAFVGVGLEEIASMPPLSASFYSSLSSSDFVLIAEQDKNVIGFCVIIKTDNQAYLKELSVDFSHSGKGVGKKLLESAILEAKNNGYKI
jgi:ribosomal protein S18 acetylase RimI-like enzyme